MAELTGAFGAAMSPRSVKAQPFRYPAIFTTSIFSTKAFRSNGFRAMPNAGPRAPQMPPVPDRAALDPVLETAGCLAGLRA
jgi:hypothetical protein